MRQVLAHVSGRQLCLALWALAAGARLLYLATARPEFTIYYWEAARSLRRDGTLAIEGVRTTVLEPLYPMFLAAAQWLVNDRPLLVQGIQALVASLGAIYLYKLAVALTGEKLVGVSSAALYAAYPLLVRHAIDGTESALVTVLLIAFLYQFVTMRRPIDAAAAGGWLALSVLTRSVALPLAVVAPVLAWRGLGKRAAIAMAGTTILLLAPYAVRNYFLNSAIAPTRGGLNLFIANNAYSGGIVATSGPDILVPYAQSRLQSLGLTGLPATPETERVEDAAFYQLAFAEISAHPFRTLQLKIANLLRFFSPVLIPRLVVTEATAIRLDDSGGSIVTNAGARPLRAELAYTISYALVLTLASAGIFIRRREIRADAVLWSVLLTFALVHAVFFPATRYRAPVEFVLLFYAGVGAVAAFERATHTSGAAATQRI